MLISVTTCVCSPGVDAYPRDWAVETDQLSSAEMGPRAPAHSEPSVTYANDAPARVYNWKISWRTSSILIQGPKRHGSPTTKPEHEGISFGKRPETQGNSVRESA